MLTEIREIKTTEEAMSALLTGFPVVYGVVGSPFPKTALTPSELPVELSRRALPSGAYVVASTLKKW